MKATNNARSFVLSPPKAIQLPHELITEICLLSVPLDGRPSAVQAPVNVSHVCRLWRAIALTSALLWNRLSLTSARTLIPGIQKLMHWREILNTWLQRSGTAPLDYTMILHLRACNAPSNNSRDAHEICGDMLLKLVKEQKRWRSMHLICDDLTNTCHQILKLSDMPLLQALHFRLAYNSGHNLASKFTFDMSSSPRLSQLHLSGLHGLTTNAVTASRLTDLSLDFEWGMPMTSSLCLEVCLEVLQSTPSLSRLQLCFPYLTRRTNLSLSMAPVVVMPHLEHFICERGVRLVIFIIEKLTLPSLKTICVGDYAESDESDLGNYLLDLVQRSEPPLEELHVISDFSNEASLLPALRLLPTVKNFALDGAWLSDTLLRALTIEGTDSDGSLVCPRLASLKLDCCGWPIHCNHLVAAMLVSRWTHTKTFEVVIQEVEPRLVQELSVHDGLLRCVEEGFEFHLHVSDDSASM